MRAQRLPRARGLTSGSSHRWLGDPIVGLAEPFTVVGWINKSGTPPTGYTVFSADTTGGSSRWQISVNASNALAAISSNTAGTLGTATAGTVPDSTWAHIAGVFASASSRTAYLNGVAGTTNTTAITVSGVNALRIGARVASSVEALFFNGDLGPLAVYRGALSAHEIGLLARGRSPLTVRPFDLIVLLGMDAPTNDLYDLVSRRRLAASGRPVVKMFPRNLLDPGRDPTFAVAALTAGAGSITGTLAATESGGDTAAFAGDVIVEGALAATESGTDTAAITGDVVVRGALAATESGADTAALAGDVLVQGALAATETGSDIAAFLGSGASPAITGTLAATEAGADVAALAGVVRIAGALAATETGADTAAFTSGAVRVVVAFTIIADGGMRIASADGIKVA